MKTNDEYPIKSTEQQRRTSEEKLKSLVIIILTAITVGAGYFAYDQHRENKQLGDLLGIEETNAQYVQETFEQIEQNLAEIRAREGVITKNLNADQLEDAESHEQRIFNEIAAIEELTAENKRMIASLNKSLDDKNGQLARYKRSARDMEKRLAEYKTRTEVLAAESKALREELNISEKQKESINIALNYKENEVDEKNRLLRQQSEELMQKEKEIRTAYYRIGTFKTLKNEHVLYKEGGIAGLAAVKSVRPDADKEQFKRIDIYDETLIPVNAKDPEIVSDHARNSYEWVQDDSGNIGWLKIKDPAKFWEHNKYLVIVTKSSVNVEVAAADKRS